MGVHVEADLASGGLGLYDGDTHLEL